MTSLFLLAIGLAILAPPPQSVAGAQPFVITNPEWIRKPTAEEMGLVLPKRTGLRSGSVRMECRAKVDGALEHCRLVSETTPGYGHGEAALKAAPFFQMRRVTREGIPVAGAMVALVVEFQLE